MIASQVAKAQIRLTVARAAIKSMENGTDYAAFRAHWYTFLMAWRSVYQALEAGSKDTPQSKQWFGGKNTERRKDDLLQYLSQARHDEEHGVGEVTRLAGGSLSVTPSNPSDGSIMTISFHVTGSNINITELKTSDGAPVVIEATPPHAKLLPVTGRGPVTFYPPTHHLGVALDTNLPIPVAKLALAYAEAMVLEAAALS